jgi:hypothetical protein
LTKFPNCLLDSHQTDPTEGRQVGGHITSSPLLKRVIFVTIVLSPKNFFAGRSGTSAHPDRHSESGKVEFRLEHCRSSSCFPGWRFLSHLSLCLPLSLSLNCHSSSLCLTLSLCLSASLPLCLPSLFLSLSPRDVAKARLGSPSCRTSVPPSRRPDSCAFSSSKNEEF